MKKIKLGIIGAGNIAKLHLEVIKHIEWMEIVGVTSRTRTKAEKLAEDYQISVCADTVESLVEATKPDALMILVSADQMYSVTKKIIPLGLPLSIEKPAGLSSKENLDLAKAAKQYGVKTMVGFNRRYYSIFHRGIEIINQYGKLFGVMVEGHERMWIRADRLPENLRANWIFANSTHTIDLLRFFGGELSNIKSIVHQTKEKRGDQFALIAESESGAIAEYIAHWYSPGGWKVVLYGEGVTVEFKPLEKGIWIDKNFESHEILPDEMDIKFKPGFYRQMEAFGKLVLEGKKDWPISDLESSYKTMCLAEKISFMEVVEKSYA